VFYGSLPVPADAEAAAGDPSRCRIWVFTCSLRDGKFEHLSVLGKHWMEQHERETYQLKKCLTCHTCGNDFAD